MTEHSYPDIQLVRGANPSLMTNRGTNTYLVGVPDPILVDAGAGDADHERRLMECLGRFRLGQVTKVLITHAHADHIGGLDRVRWLFPNAPVYRCFPDGPDDPAFDPIEDGSLIEYAGGFLRAIHTPGHARDHVCFFDDARGILFSGDHIVGEGTVFVSPEGGGMAAYMASLERLLALDVRAIFPAHGPAIEPGRPKIEEYLAHRRMRERQVLEGLRGGARCVPELVRTIYAEVPRSLHGLAAESTLSHLLKLEAEGAVRSREERGERLWALAGEGR
jgi:glyoxylase-like metal-dependent hydrolase (beta-lactamase superfamily II)